jgi:hypothetical protein
MEMQNANVAQTNQVDLLQKKLTIEASIQRGTNWFFWIGGLSIINSLIYFFGGSLTFVLGLGATQFIDGVASAVAGELSANGGMIVRFVGFSLDIAIAGLFITAGFLGQKRYRWAIIAGMVFYTLDGLIFLFFREWLAVGFHGLALWNLWRGLQSINELKVFTQNVSIPPFMNSAEAELPWYKSNGVRILGAMALIFAGIVVALITISFILTR